MPENNQKHTMTSYEVLCTSKLYKLVLAHIAKTATSGKIEADVQPARRQSPSELPDLSDDENYEDESKHLLPPLEISDSRIGLEAGLGDFSFTDFHGTPMATTHSMLGLPVSGTYDKYPAIYRSLTVSCGKGRGHLIAFFSKLVKDSEASVGGYIKIFHWMARSYHWHEVKGQCLKARPLDSVRATLLTFLLFSSSSPPLLLLHFSI